MGKKHTLSDAPEHPAFEIFYEAQVGSRNVTRPVCISQEPDRNCPVKVHIGCSGWFYWHWKGLFYPAELPTHKWFKHYNRHFKTVELNAPFYRWPQPSTVKTWVRQSSPRFKYCIKV